MCSCKIYPMRWTFHSTMSSLIARYLKKLKTWPYRCPSGGRADGSAMKNGCTVDKYWWPFLWHHKDLSAPSFPFHIIRYIHQSHHFHHRKPRQKDPNNRTCHLHPRWLFQSIHYSCWNLWFAMNTYNIKGNFVSRSIMSTWNIQDIARLFHVWLAVAKGEVDLYKHEYHKAIVFHHVRH